MAKCPGQDTRYWLPKDVSEVQCSRCGYGVEFFKTDGSRRCPSCGARVVNPVVSLGCAQWCQYAKECLGFDPKSVDVVGRREESIAERLIGALKAEFGADQRRISHALRVLDRAETIMRHEGGRPLVVIAAALLHDIGIREAERKYGSSAPEYQEIEGPPIARRMLEEIGLEEDIVEQVCRIVGCHHRADLDTPEFRIVWDADNIVNLAEEGRPTDAAQVEEALEKILMTKKGRELARIALAQKHRSDAGCAGTPAGATG